MSKLPYDIDYDYPQATPPEIVKLIKNSTDGEQLRKLAEDAPPSRQDLQRELIAENLHTPADVLSSLLDAELEEIHSEDPEWDLEVPDPILKVLGSIIGNESAEPETLEKLLDAAMKLHQDTAARALRSSNLPQERVEDEFDLTPDLLKYIKIREWLKIFKDRDDERSREVARILEGMIAGQPSEEQWKRADRQLALDAADIVGDSE